MVNLKVGTKLENIKTGKNEKGNWLFGEVLSQNGYDKIKVFSSNPDDIDSKKDLYIKCINSVERSKSKGTGKYEDRWFENVTVNALLSNSLK